MEGLEMSVQQTVTSFDKESIRSMSQSKQEPAWLTELRLQAFEKYESMELPKLEKSDLSKKNFHNLTLPKLNEYTHSNDIPVNMPSIFRESEDAHSMVIYKN